jgi:hypothetical protein
MIPRFCGVGPRIAACIYVLNMFAWVVPVPWQHPTPPPAFTPGPALIEWCNTNNCN